MLIFVFFHSASAIALETVILLATLLFVEICNGVTLVGTRQPIGRACSIEKSRR